MKKPAKLRAALEASSHWLSKHPDNLLVFADEGHVAARLGASTSYETGYTLNLIVTDFPEDPATIMVPILGWLAVNQPEALLNHQRGDRVIEFEADILNHSTVDLSIKLQLTERVIITTDPNTGAVSATYADEPPLDPYHDVASWELLYTKPDTAPDHTVPDPTPI